MKRILVATAAAALTITAFGTAQAAQHSAKLKVAICHRTKSNAPGKSFVRIVVRTKAALAHHRQHPQDIIPATATCPKRGVTPTRGGVVLSATLTGATEVPPGDLDGTGTATIRTIPGSAYLCFSISVQNITLPATAAHIHRAPLGQAGPVVVPLKAPDASGKASGCTNVANPDGSLNRTLVKQILADPAGFYANVHTSDHPAGAVRGQLSK